MELSTGPSYPELELRDPEPSKMILAKEPTLANIRLA
jgi:hypothetical protein